MKALVFHGKQDVRVESVPDPTPPDSHGALVKVERAAICGSDLHLYHGDMPVEAGFVVGHEFVGEVMETGSSVANVRVGDHVLVSGVIGCGLCPRCLRGEVVRCEFSAYPNVERWYRTISERLAVKRALASLEA